MKMFRKELVNWKKPIGQGFTLIEVMIVVAMLGIIAAIAIPRLVANDRTDMNPLQQINNQVNVRDSNTEINQMGPGVYEIWLKDCNKFIKINVSDVGG